MQHNKKCIYFIRFSKTRSLHSLHRDRDCDWRITKCPRRGMEEEEGEEEETVRRRVIVSPQPNRLERGTVRSRQQKDNRVDFDLYDRLFADSDTTITQVCSHTHKYFVMGNYDILKFSLPYKGKSDITCVKLLMNIIILV